MSAGRIPPVQSATIVAGGWAEWCGDDNRWVKAMREFGELGGQSQWWCGMPSCASAIPLTFTLVAPDGQKLECNYRLKDITAAVTFLKQLTVTSALR